jgi:hypothetical protein
LELSVTCGAADATELQAKKANKHNERYFDFVVKRMVWVFITLVFA